MPLTGVEQPAGAVVLPQRRSEFAVGLHTFAVAPILRVVQGMMEVVLRVHQCGFDFAGLGLGHLTGGRVANTSRYPAPRKIPMVSKKIIPLIPAGLRQLPGAFLPRRQGDSLQRYTIRK